MTLLTSPCMIHLNPCSIPKTFLPSSRQRIVAAPITPLIPGAGPPPTNMATVSFIENSPSRSVWRKGLSNASGILWLNYREYSRAPSRSELNRYVPPLDCRDTVIVGQDIHCRRIEQKMLPGRRGKAKPASAVDSEHVTMCEQYSIALDMLIGCGETVACHGDANKLPCHMKAFGRSLRCFARVNCGLNFGNSLAD